MSAANRMSPQQLHQVQQARAVQQAQAQVQHVQALAQAQAMAQAQNAIPNLNGSGSTMGNPHPQYATRDATSSPAHASPPRNSATPSNAANSPGQPSAQASMLQAQVPGNAVPRQSINMGGQQYYLPGTFTPEQIQILRAQMMVCCRLLLSFGNY
jgi:chromatin modification-related protein VID21